MVAVQSKKHGNLPIVDRIAKWSKKRDPIGLVALICIVLAGAAYLITSASKSYVESVEAVTGVLSTSAQVCATIAGFLIVAMIFLYNERAELIGLPWRVGYWPWFDVILYLVTVVLFVYVALFSIEGLGYTLGKTELDAKMQNYAWTAIMVSKIGLWLLAVGFGYFLGFVHGRAKRKSDS